MRSLAKIKPSQNDENSLSFTDVGKSCKTRQYFSRQTSFNAIRENKILQKIFKFTVQPSQKISVKSGQVLLG